MKRAIAILCVIMLCIGITACGNKTDGTTPSGNKTDDTAFSEVAHVSDKFFFNSYWTAVQLIPAYPLGDGEPVLNVDLYADIIFYPDGNAKFHNVRNGLYVDDLEKYAECEWKYDETTNEVTLSVPDTGDSLILDYDFDGTCLIYTDGNGDKLRFDNNSDFPSGGAEYCAADVLGSWKLLSLVFESTPAGEVVNAEDIEMSGAITFLSVDDALAVNFVNTSADGTELSVWERPVMVEQCAMYDGCENDDWTMLFTPAETDIFAQNEYYATLLDGDTLKVMIFSYTPDGDFEGVYYQFYGRE